MKHVLRWSVLLLAAVPGVRLLAQSPEAHVQLSGVVLDATGSGIPGAEVNVRSGIGASAKVYTGKDGSFSSAVQPGPIQVDVAELGFARLHWETQAASAKPVRLVMSVSRDADWGPGQPAPDMPVEQSSSSTEVQPLPLALIVHRSPVGDAANNAHWEFGVQVSGGVGLEDRSNFSFFNAGVHAGKVLTDNYGHGALRANFEYGVEVLPLWQSYTPQFQRLNCPTGATVASQCKGPTTTGGTYRGASIVPIILRINFTHGQRIMPWVQGAGGVLYTTRKYPGIGNLNVGDPTQTGPAADTSVWNFTPQGGVGMHYFVKPRRSLDFSVNAEHISSASLGDKNPGVNDSLQFAVGYSWWK